MLSSLLPSNTAGRRCARIFRLFVAALAFSLICGKSLATTYIWTGGGGGLLFNLPLNWSIGIPLSSGTTDLVFAGATNTGSALLPLNLNLGTFTLNSLAFNAGSGSFFMGGNDLKFAGSTNSITQNSSSAQSIANNISSPNGKPTTLTLDGSGSGTVTLSGVITGANGGRDYTVVKNGTSTFSLTGANDYAAGTTINGGRIIANTAASLGTGALIVNAGTLEVAGSYTDTRAITVGDVTSTFDVDASQTYTVSSVISGTGVLNKNGSGTMVLSGANTYSGGTVINAGELKLGAAGVLKDTSAVTVAGGTFNVATFSETVGALNLTSGSIIGTGTLTASSYDVQAGSISALLGGIGKLTKTGAGTVTLSGANTYSGGSQIDAGTVIVSADANLGTAALALNAGTLNVAGTYSTARSITLGSSSSTVAVDAAQTFTVSTVMNGTGALNKAGTGTMVLSASNSFSGGTSVSAGTLRLGATDRLLNSGALSVSGGTFDLQSFSETVGAVTLASGSITGTGTLTSSTGGFSLQSGTASAILAGSVGATKTTSGTVILSAANTYTGATAVNAGTLQVNANGALGTVASGTTVASGAALRLNGVNYITAEGLTINGTGISNGGALVNSGTSTFAGHVTAATNATINAGGGVLTFTGGLTKNGTTLTIAGGGTVNINGQGIDGSSANSDLVVDGTTVVLNAANSYNGPTTVQNTGTLRLGANNVFPTTPQTALTVNTSSVLDMNGKSDSVATLAGDSTGVVKNTSVGTTSTLTVNPATAVASTFAGAIAGTNSGAQGNIALTKSGAGTLTLTGVNTYTGATTVNGGKLIAAAAGTNSALGSTAAIVINTGGTLQLGASNQINNGATLALAGGTFAKGDFSEGSDIAAGVGTLTLTGSGSHLDFGIGSVGTLSFASFVPAGNTLVVDNWTGTPGTIGTAATDRLIFNANQSANLLYFSFNTGSGTVGAQQFDLGNGYYEVMPITPAPEPGTFLAGIPALLAIGFLHRKQIARRFNRQRRSEEPEA